MKDFAEDFMRDVPRGDSARLFRQQTVPKSRWMPIKEIQASKALAYNPRAPGSKVLIGALGAQLIGIEDDRHIMTVAGSRSGKSVGLVSNLLFYSGSILATDPKGELADLTAERREAMGQKVYVLDPFKRTSAKLARFRASFNPMSSLSVLSESFMEDAALLAESLVVQAPDQKEPHWDESAKNFIEGVIVHVATSSLYEGRRNLITVRGLLSKSRWVPRAEPTATAKKSDKTPALFSEMERNAISLSEAPATAAIGNALMGATIGFYQKEGAEMAGVFSTFDRHTKFLDYPAFHSVLEENDFGLADLKREPKGISIYLCFPATRIELSRRWLRMFINQLLDAMEREPTKPKVPVLACLDEFPVLGYMKQLETAAGQIASFGVKLWTILQDWGQGKALYGDRWETFVGNAGVLQFFGNNDVATTEYISKLLGKTPVEVTRTGEVGQEQREKGLSGHSEAIELHDLLTPDEIRRQFARDDRLQRQLVIWTGHHPMMLQRIVHHDPAGPLATFLPGVVGNRK